MKFLRPPFLQNTSGRLLLVSSLKVLNKLSLSCKIKVANKLLFQTSVKSFFFSILDVVGVSVHIKRRVSFTYCYQRRFIENSNLIPYVIFVTILVEIKNRYHLTLVVRRNEEAKELLLNIHNYIRKTQVLLLMCE